MRVVLCLVNLALISPLRSHLTQDRGVRSSNPFGDENSSVADSSFLRGTRQRRSYGRPPCVEVSISDCNQPRYWPFGDCTVAKGDEKITLPAAGPVNVTNPAKKTRRPAEVWPLYGVRTAGYMLLLMMMLYIERESKS